MSAKHDAHPTNNSPITVNGETVTQNLSAKLLGINLDNHLQLSSHVHSKVTSKNPALVSTTYRLTTCLYNSTRRGSCPSSPTPARHSVPTQPSTYIRLPGTVYPHNQVLERQTPAPSEFMLSNTNYILQFNPRQCAGAEPISSCTSQAVLYLGQQGR